MKLWVVELWNEDKKRWESTVETGLTKKDAGIRKRAFQETCPDDKFRIQKYARVESEKKQPGCQWCFGRGFNPATGHPCPQCC